MFLKFLYNTFIGRCVLKALTKPALSRQVGKLLSSRASKILIPGFVKRNEIDLAEIEDSDFTCFNDCFTRKLKSGIRKIDTDENSLVSPCDGLLTAYHIAEDLVIPVKHSRYAISDLLRDVELAKKYDGGECLVFRLTTKHYHRYIFPADGLCEKGKFIQGVLHTVRPVAMRKLPVFVENSREYTIIHTEKFGDIIQMEVGALLVGEIANEKLEGPVKKGMEKGKFLYGGSTIILLIEPGKVDYADEIFESETKHEEISVLLGEKIGTKKEN